jgi:hypothetical protein
VRQRGTNSSGSIEQANVKAHSASWETTATSRWLRGRILDRLRDGSGWVELAAAIGSHDRAAVEAALDDSIGHVSDLVS